MNTTATSTALLFLFLAAACQPVYELRHVEQEDDVLDVMSFDYGPLPEVPHPTTHGVVAYARADGGAFLLESGPDAVPQALDPSLDKLSQGSDLAVNIAASGKWLGLLSERFDCEWACAVLATRDLSYAEPIIIDGQALHPSGPFAVGSTGRSIVFSDAGGPHESDLWITRRTHTGWERPRLLTESSRHNHNMLPALRADDQEVLFDCGALPYGDEGTSLCAVRLDDGQVREVVKPDSAVFGTVVRAVHHGDFAPDGGIVFECDSEEHGEGIWHLPPADTKPVRLGQFHNDNSPCALPNGQIASLYLARPGNHGNHEMKIMASTGSDDFMALVDVNVLDTQISCGL